MTQPKWNISITSGKSFLPAEFEGVFDYIDLGIDKIAFVVKSKRSLYYSSITNNDLHEVMLGIDDLTIEKIHWNKDESKLLIVSEKLLAIFTLENPNDIQKIPIANERNSYIDAVWGDNNIIFSIVDRGVIRSFDASGENIDTIEVGSNPTSITYSNNQVFVGQNGFVHVFTLSEKKLEAAVSFKAAPTKIEEIYSNEKVIIISARRNTVLWNYDTLIPMYKVKAEGSPIYVDPTFTFGLYLKEVFNSEDIGRFQPMLHSLSQGPKKEVTSLISLPEENYQFISWGVDDSHKAAIASAKQLYIIKIEEAKC